jgi:hypothetical protein
LLLSFIYDAVTAADGITYERTNIEAWILQQLDARGVPFSPVTKQRLRSTSLTPNIFLLAHMQEALQLQEHRGRTRRHRQLLEKEKKREREIQSSHERIRLDQIASDNSGKENKRRIYIDI